MFVKTEQTPNCSIPCSTSTCKIETYHYIRCPVWYCSAIPTPSPSPPGPSPPGPSPPGPSPPGPSPPGPSPPSPPGPSPSPNTENLCTSALCISSVSFNIIFGLALIILIAMIVRYKKNTRRTIQRQNDSEADDRTPIIPSSGFVNVPLAANEVSLESQTQPPSNRLNLTHSASRSFRQMFKRRNQNQPTNSSETQQNDTAL